MLEKYPYIDYITICGIGEPTLNTDIGSIIRQIKDLYPYYKLALITNSTTLHDLDLCEAILLCDLIMPSLDAASQKVFEKINRPHKDLQISQIIESLIAFRQKFKNQLWLEIFFLENINDTENELKLLKEACLKIKPDLIQINSLDRNGLFDWVKKMPQKRLQEIKAFFEPLQAVIV
jgi:wyosine [tRNA(Phe)-imidazoG37] synthetase (radical SAM superfamily)